ncbi:MAG: hypothetical protein DI533_20040 [Cereibacter sphaeroides]|uniref:2TM domain-containing protein n=1 Tax=Cereibacter sphaeroides TaxID=1063 RepID=A0A2W5TWJ1_CERSP|nr:MAG: hypothetical protein DI533_20040 [Cereibacter sphaeroides]
MTRKSYTRKEERAFARHVSIHRVMRLWQAVLALGGIAGAVWSGSWHWLFWAGVAAWAFNKAVPPDDDLDRIM